MNNKGFSVSWSYNPNALGTKPPHPQFMNDPIPSNMLHSGMLIKTELADPTNKGSSIPVGLIQSKRQPYAVEHAFTKYGDLNTRLGTNMGT